MRATPARTALRAATAADHTRLDGLFADLDLAKEGDYARFLAAHAAALPTVEAALDDAGFNAALPDWPARRRAGLLRDDLSALGLAPPQPLPAPVLAGAAACWGAAYVIEGSRLGGALLARSVGTGLPRAYLSQPQPRGAWRAFVAALDAAIVSDEQLGHATTAARATFGLFEFAGRRAMESRPA